MASPSLLPHLVPLTLPFPQTSKPYVAVKSHGGQDASIRIVQQIAIIIHDGLRRLAPSSQPCATAAPYSIESFGEVLKSLWLGIRLHRGKGESCLRQYFFVMGTYCFDRLVKALHSSRKPSSGCCLIGRQRSSRAPCSSSCTRSWRLTVRRRTHC